MKTGYSSKSCDLGFKVDSDSRIVKGYFAAFGNIDSDRDMLVKGAFAKSIKEHGVDSTSNRKIMHLAFHDVKRPVGKLTVLKEDDKGLYFESKIGTHKDGEDALRMYKEGIINEHSFGFNYIKDKTTLVEAKDDKESYYELSEVKLWEGSLVSFGANSETPNLTGKSKEEIEDIADELANRTEKLIKAIIDGEYSEKYNELFKVELMQINSAYKSLINREPSIKDTIEAKSDTRTEEEARRDFYLKSLI